MSKSEVGSRLVPLTGGGERLGVGGGEIPLQIRYTDFNTQSGQPDVLH